MRVSVDAAGPAAKAGMMTGDRILSVDGHDVANWDELTAAVSKSPGQEIPIVVERDAEQLTLTVTPAAPGTTLDDKDISGKILVRPPHKRVSVGVGEAAKLAILEPPAVVYNTVRTLVRAISGQEQLDVKGPGGIVKAAKEYAELGPGDFLKFLGALSAYLGAFNMLPFPALDGGRLMFLMFEAISRRRPDAKIEARVHAFGLLLLLGVLVVVTYLDFMPK
jgi:regulator of sigma E protease